MALPLTARGLCVRRPTHRIAHSLGNIGPRHLDVFAQTRARAHPPRLVVGIVAIPADWRDDATDPRHMHVATHLGLTAATVE